MEILNDDMIILLFTKLIDMCDVSHIMFGYTSHKYKKLLNRSNDNINIFKKIDTSYLMYNKYFNILNWVVYYGIKLNPKTCIAAVSIDNFNMLKWSYKNGCIITDELCEYIFMEGTVDILKWIFEIGYEMINPALMHKIATGCIIKILREHDYYDILNDKNNDEIKIYVYNEITKYGKLISLLHEKCGARLNGRCKYYMDIMILCYKITKWYNDKFKKII
jgi:hypothetical protein